MERQVRKIDATVKIPRGGGTRKKAGITDVPETPKEDRRPLKARGLREVKVCLPDAIAEELLKRCGSEVRTESMLNVYLEMFVAQAIIRELLRNETVILTDGASHSRYLTDIKLSRKARSLTGMDYNSRRAIKMMVEMRNANKPYVQIARKLNQMGLRTRMGSKWSCERLLKFIDSTEQEQHILNITTRRYLKAKEDDAENRIEQSWRWEDFCEAGDLPG